MAECEGTEASSDGRNRTPVGLKGRIHSRYADYAPLNALWTEYYHSIEGSFSEYNSIPFFECRKRDAIKGMGKEGCLLSVVRSCMPQDIGIEGIVVLETRNQFVLVTKKDRLKKVNKKGHLFQLLGVEGRGSSWASW